MEIITDSEKGQLSQLAVMECDKGVILVVI